MAVNFPSSPTNGDTVTVGGIAYVYDSTQGVWSDSPQGLTQSIDKLTDVDTSTTAPANRQVLQWNSTDEKWKPADSGVQVYATIDDLPLSGVTEGSMALVDSTDKLYIFSDAGWYSIAIVNQTPSISGVNATYTLATDGTATVVTVTATDPEGLPITYSIVSDTSGNIATVTQGTGANTNQWTITPTTNTANAGDFTLVFRASDGVNIASASSTFELQFSVTNSHYTTALITSVGANNAVNNSFDDASTNNHTITANGNVTQNTFSPYRHGGYSIYCDGANVMDLGFSTLNSGNWTFECWALVETGETILGKYGGGNQLEGFGVSNTTGYMYTHTNVGVETPTCNTDLRDGKWHYLVWERYNGTYYYWADGSLETSFSNSESPGATGNWVLGGVASSRFKGKIKEARFSLSTAVYSGSTPTTPTEPQTTSNSTDAFFTGVGLEIKDYSSNNRTFTVPSTFVSAPTAPYDYTPYSASVNGGSMYFDGTGDYLSVPYDAGFNMGATTDFTMEAWVYQINQTGNHTIFSQYNGSGTAHSDVNGHRWIFWIDDGKVQLYQYPDMTTQLIDSGTLKLNTWNHVAATREGSVFRLFVNGIQVDTLTSSTIEIGFLNDPLTVGSYNSTGYFNGMISDVRVVKGTAVYTSAFTPPTAPLTEITNTSLLLNGTNAGIIDKSQSVQTLTLNGDVKSSTTQTKYLSSSMYFDGTGDYIEVVDALGEFTDYSDATLEMWVYPTTSSGSQNLIEKFTPASGPGWTLYTTTGTLNLQWYGGGTTNSSTAMTVNQWNHVAVVHYNGTRKIYVNGTGGTGVTVTSSVSTNPLRIGVRGTTGNYFNGYMSDIRIQLGRAVYTADFTPPTESLKG